MRSIWLRAVVLRRAVDSGVGICSLHFRPEDFEQHLHVSRSLGKSMKFPRLRKDAIPSLSLRKEPTPQRQRSTVTSNGSCMGRATAVHQSSPTMVSDYIFQAFIIPAPEFDE
uniref:Putative secreted protein n=1 Tax=Ixodes ricinus TaxID=34613 RepID=A0A6B0UJZ2_IXORI